MSQTIWDLVNSMYLTFIHSNPIQQYGILGVIIVGLVPSFVLFVPDESVLIPVYQSNPTVAQFHTMLLAYGLSVFVSNTLMFYTAHHLTNLIRQEKKKAQEARHMLYKYRIPVFLIAPSFIFGIGDLIIIIAGIKHFNYMGIFPYLFVGSFIRALWGILIAVYGPAIFGFHP